MSIWKNSKMFCITSGGDITADNFPCEVLIDDKNIVVSYFEEGKPIKYAGANKLDGHFRLQCNENGGYCTLHKFADENIMNGFWVEGGAEGFWRVELK